MTSLDAVLEQREVVICCGPGGVGKTTLSASLALRAAQLGRKAVVCTIDPARRLASSLGLSELGNVETEVSKERLASAGLVLEGSLSALMLEPKQQFDALIARVAKTDEARQRVLENRFYQTISGNVVGSSEFMAMEKLYELHSQKRYDLIVLDTPPTKHALDFLTAPRRMTDVLDKSVLDVLMRPFSAAGALSFGIVKRMAKKIARKVARGATAQTLIDLIGIQFVHDLAEFFQAFDGLYDGFRDRAARVNELLREKVTGFVVVASPNAIPLKDARFFCEKLRELGMPLDAVVLNRVHPSLLGDEARAALAPLVQGAEAQEKLVAQAASSGGALVGRAVSALIAQEYLARGDRRRIDELKARLPGVLVREVPRFGTDVYDLPALRRLSDVLFGDRA